MKKCIYTLLFALITITTFAQNNPRPSKSRFWNSKLSTFKITAGDVLVYDVTDSINTYSFIVTVKKFGDAISFGFSAPDKNIYGSGSITASAVKSANSYSNSFNNGSMNLKDKSTIWLSKQNYKELESGDKKTSMNVGRGLENFAWESTSTQKIIYKGKEKIITIYKVVNENAADKKELSILTDADNPLITNLNIGLKAILKEVR